MTCVRQGSGSSFSCLTTSSINLVPTVNSKDINQAFLFKSTHPIPQQLHATILRNPEISSPSQSKSCGKCVIVWVGTWNWRRSAGLAVPTCNRISTSNEAGSSTLEICTHSLPVTTPHYQIVVMHWLWTHTGTVLSTWWTADLDMETGLEASFKLWIQMPTSWHYNCSWHKFHLMRSHQIHFLHSKLSVSVLVGHQTLFLL
jgi:hypothetical protein